MGASFWRSGREQILDAQELKTAYKGRYLGGLGVDVEAKMRSSTWVVIQELVSMWWYNIAR